VCGDKEMKMKDRRQTMTITIAGALALGVAGAWVPTAQGAETYTATLVPMNAKAAGTEVRGKAVVMVSGADVTFELQAQGLPPSMMHMAHLHGFANDGNATCPGTQADVNRDGVVDLLETESTSGVTMIPFNAQPAALKIASDTYPMASKDGRVAYRQQLSLAGLSSAMSTEFNGASPGFSNRVIFLHGIPTTARLPKTAASLPGVPAQVTIPIACGKLVRAD
jgi:hypothetical protein